ncbi:MAG: glutaminase, partial [Paramuribaculum sp.]|nr:glutaminase [Paramuribaculum sp.]
VNPVTRAKVFDPAIAPKITTLIATVVFYDKSCYLIYTSGIPAKSGVGGGVLGVLPGVLGIAAFAPPLDEAGNSVKAQAAIKEFAGILGLGVMNGNRVTIAG